MPPQFCCNTTSDSQFNTSILLQTDSVSVSVTPLTPKLRSTTVPSTERCVLVLVLPYLELSADFFTSVIPSTNGQMAQPLTTNLIFYYSIEIFATKLSPRYYHYQMYYKEQKTDY